MSHLKNRFLRLSPKRQTQRANEPKQRTTEKRDAKKANTR